MKNFSYYGRSKYLVVFYILALRFLPLAIIFIILTIYMQVLCITLTPYWHFCDILACHIKTFTTTSAVQLQYAADFFLPLALARLFVLYIVSLWDVCIFQLTYICMINLTFQISDPHFASTVCTYSMHVQYIFMYICTYVPTHIS